MSDFFSFIHDIEINPTELCNLQCSFCPRAHGYPNQNIHMSLETAAEIKRQLELYNFTGALSITGRGEPTLHPQINELVDLFLKDSRFETRVTTNGKKLNKLEKYFGMYEGRLRIIYDVYDVDQDYFYSEKQKYLKYSNVSVKWKPDYGAAGIVEPEEFWAGLHRRTDYSHEKNDEFKFISVSNRGGYIEKKKYNFLDNSCVKLSKGIYIDWNGNYNLCCDDWTPLVLGNIFQEDIKEFVNNNETLTHYRKKHLCENTRDGLPACQTCDRNTPVKPEIKEAMLDLIND